MDYLNKSMSIEYSEDRAALFQYLKKLLELPMDQRKELAAADDNFGVMAELLRSTKRRRNCRESRIIIFPTQIACIGGTGQMRSGLRRKPING